MSAIRRPDDVRSGGKDKGGEIEELPPPPPPSRENASSDQSTIEGASERHAREVEGLKRALERSERRAEKESKRRKEAERRAAELIRDQHRTHRAAANTVNFERFEEGDAEAAWRERSNNAARGMKEECWYQAERVETSPRRISIKIEEEDDPETYDAPSEGAVTSSHRAVVKIEDEGFERTSPVGGRDRSREVIVFESGDDSSMDISEDEGAGDLQSPVNVKTESSETGECLVAESSVPIKCFGGRPPDKEMEMEEAREDRRSKAVLRDDVGKRGISGPLEESPVNVKIESGETGGCLVAVSSFPIKCFDGRPPDKEMKMEEAGEDRRSKAVLRDDVGKRGISGPPEECVLAKRPRTSGAETVADASAREVRQQRKSQRRCDPTRCRHKGESPSPVICESYQDRKDRGDERGEGHQGQRTRIRLAKAPGAKAKFLADLIPLSESQPGRVSEASHSRSSSFLLLGFHLIFACGLWLLTKIPSAAPLLSAGPPG